MKTIKVNLPRSLKEIEIVTLADLHIGDKFCDLKLVKSWVDYIRDNDNVYTILNGDLMNNAIKNSVSNVYEDVMTPTQQLYYLRDLFMPIKDKILAITSGNHERRTSKESDMHLSRTLSTFLDKDDVYSEEGVFLFVRLGELNKKATGKQKRRQVCYTIYVTHGSGSALKSNPAEGLSDSIDADVYIHSHIHQPQKKYGAVFRADTKNNTVSKFDRLYIITGSTLGYGGYAQIKKYKPSSNRNPILVLDGSKKLFWEKS
ncbi:MAG: metallophosphoesterase [Bacteroidales bacterium]|nr:metallophosphoesterase [Bacteroidales bacterium]